MAFLALVSEGVLTDGWHSQANWPLSISWLRSFPSTLFITPPTGLPWRTEMSSHCPVQYPPSSQACPVLSTKDHRTAAACSSGDSLPLLLSFCCDVSRTHLVMWLPCWKRCRALHYVQNKIPILSFLFWPWRKGRCSVPISFRSTLNLTPAANRDYRRWAESNPWDLWSSWRRSEWVGFLLLCVWFCLMVGKEKKQWRSCGVWSCVLSMRLSGMHEVQILCLVCD